MSETTYTGTGKRPGLNWVHEETTTGVSADQVIADQVNKLKMIDDLCAKLTAKDAEIERLRGIIRKVENLSFGWINGECRTCCDSHPGEDHEPDCPFYRWEGAR